MLRAYLAHNYAARTMLLGLVGPLRKAGIEVCSRWVFDGEEAAERTAESNQHYAEMDIEDIDRSHMIVYFTDDFEGAGGMGKHFELGYAYALNPKLTVVLIGKRRMDRVFYFLDRMDHYETIDELLVSPKYAWARERYGEK